ncbi:hypothetical protein NA56DRAFT_702994 [Hyaloscypha hepaticicola]|uniref:Uncharacterized protein n=1 Tax=Hyaloscypha hepaticicola TaxID=2082293 RepID=A0A2J6Q6W8_9HELO|nr:hypothetical protein NA56DRAFT_702994 [Hyaloscypha hepaticicola]
MCDHRKLHNTLQIHAANARQAIYGRYMQHPGWLADRHLMPAALESWKCRQASCMARLNLGYLERQRRCLAVWRWNCDAACITLPHIGPPSSGRACTAQNRSHGFTPHRPASYHSYQYLCHQWKSLNLGAAQAGASDRSTKAASMRGMDRRAREAIREAGPRQYFRAVCTTSLIFFLTLWLQMSSGRSRRRKTQTQPRALRWA